MEHVGSSTAGALAVGVESGVRQRGRAITALIAAVVADGLSSIATYLCFGE